MDKLNYLPDVKAQYEQLPYPPCNPEDDRHRLMRTWLDSLAMINHYCFAGRQTFERGFRALVAGGGTGDTTIYLAEQLRNTDAEIVHLDLSAASIAIAQRRAAIRKLDNIRWVQQSILDIPTLELGAFDYINCSGVLHHLADPDAGLRALRGALAPGGAIGLMVYGSIGRTAIYQMQALLRLANQGVDDVGTRLTHAKEVLANLPPLNWYRLAGEDYGDDRNDAGIYDSLLHTRDRAYTVPELYQWLADDNGLHIELTDVDRGRFPYLPELTLAQGATELRARLPGMRERDRYALSELLMGDITRHLMFLTAGPGAKAPYGQADFIPYYFNEPCDSAVLADLFAPKGGAPTMLQHKAIGATLVIDAGRYSGMVFRHIDGMRTFAEIFELVRAHPACRAAPPDDATLFADFRPAFEALNALDRILLRHVSCRH